MFIGCVLLDFVTGTLGLHERQCPTLGNLFKRRIDSRSYISKDALRWPLNLLWCCSRVQQDSPNSRSVEEQPFISTWELATPWRLSDCLIVWRTSKQDYLINKRQTVISREGNPINKYNGFDLLHLLRSCVDTRRSDCIRLLRRSDQELVMKIMDNGGSLAWNLCQSLS